MSFQMQWRLWEWFCNVLLEVYIWNVTLLYFFSYQEIEYVPSWCILHGKGLLLFPESLSAGPSGCCEVIFFGSVVDTSLLDKDCIFSCGTIVTCLVTVNLPCSCNCKQGLIRTNETLPAAKWYWTLFDFLWCWALLVLLGVSDFSTPIYHQGDIWNVPFACLLPVKS